MVGEEGKDNGCGVMDCGGGITVKVENGESAESSREGLQICKRKRHDMSDASGTKSLDDNKLAAESVSQPHDKAIEDRNKGIAGMSSSQQLSSHAVMSNDSVDCPLGGWRKNLLEQIYQSLCQTEDGLIGCIRDALLLHPENSSNIAAKLISTYDGLSPDAANWDRGVESNGSLSESNQTNTDLCGHAFKDIIMSENFAQLSRVLIENFQGVKFDSFLDINLLNERMKDGTYEKTPLFFHSDIQKVWMKLQKVGAEMVTIGKNLSEKSKASYHKQVGGLQGCSKDAEFVNGESSSGPKAKQPESSCEHKVLACRFCGKNGDGRDCLVCDSCEEMYHISCIHLSVEEIPSRSWYCPNCEVHDKDSPHIGCVVCEKLHNSRPPSNDDVHMEESSSDETSNGTTEHEDDGEKLQCCTICRVEVDGGGEEVKACGHPYCPHKYYHVKCLTGQQLRVHGPCWYCPSCLCRACLTDDDDEKIVLCDGCDHAYHIYCMKPPRTTIPKGKWFCKNCQQGVRKLHKAGKVYKFKHHGFENGGQSGKRANEDVSDESGGVDMLLTAARALNQEEEMAETNRLS